MTKERLQKLIEDDKEPLTQEEIKEGWHFCLEFDGLLVGPESPEWQYCLCFADKITRQKNYE